MQKAIGPEKWDIHSDSNHSTYFLGLKLVNDSDLQLAWVELDINNRTGIITIADKGIL